MGKLSVSLLGRLRVADGAANQIAVRGRKTQALLVFLALNADRPQPRNRLATLLWGDRFDDQARQSLRQCVSKLRKALGNTEPPVLLTDGDQVGLNGDAIEIDVRVFERLAAQGTPKALAEAAYLCSATLAEGLDVKQTAFDDWLGAERRRVNDLAYQVLERLAAHQAGTEDSGAAIETAQRLVGLDPLREEAHRTLMRLYVRTGRRAAALKQFQACAETLHRELGAGPESETRRLYEEIKSQGAIPPATDRAITDAGPAAKAPLALPDKPSIAVLPFSNLSGDPEQGYFSDGITEDIITALSNVQSFFVIARDSTFAYQGKAVDMKRVGRELGVRYVLEGSVRKSGNRVRVTAQLVEAASGNTIWADRYDGALDDIFDLQDEITASVVGAIEPQLLCAEVQRIRQKRPESLDAYDYTLRGLAHMNKLNPDDTAEGLRLFLRAIEVDPNYAHAYVCASWYYRRQVQLRGMVLSDEDKAEGIRLAQAALKADSTDPYVLWQAGMTAALVEGDFDAAVLYIDRSLSINANSTRAWLAGGSVRCCVGDPETAIEDANRAIRLSPLDVAMWVAHGVLATAHLQLADYEEAAAWARKSVRQHAYNAPAHHVLAACCAHLGRTEEAGAAVARSLELDPDMTIPRLKAIYPVSGYRNLDGFCEGLRKAGLAD